MGKLERSAIIRKPVKTMRLIVTTIAGLVFGFLIGLSFPTLPLTKLILHSCLPSSIDHSYIDEKISALPIQTFQHAEYSSIRDKNSNGLSKISVPLNPRAEERLPPGIVASESDFYPRRLWGNPSEDLTIRPKYLATFTVSYDQKHNVDAAVKKFSENFTILLFHYDGRTTEWDEFEWSKRAIHVSVQKQAKWWYAKRFLHPDIVAPYDYIFIWDEDLGVENFNAEEYIKVVRKHGLDISQPGLEADDSIVWKLTERQADQEVHKEAKKIPPGWCTYPHLPPCAAFVEIMAPVFSRDAWRCVWHLIQNDLVHGWGLDFVVRKCVEPDYEKIGVVDAQWVVHQNIPTLGNQGEAENGQEFREGVRQRSDLEWAIFIHRLENAEEEYYKAMGITLPNSTADLGTIREEADSIHSP